MLLRIARLALGFLAHAFKHVGLRRCLFGKPPCYRPQRLCACNGGELDLPCPDTIGSLIQQANGCVAVRRFGLVTNRRRRADRLGQLAVERVEVAKADLVDNRHAVELRQQFDARIGFGPLQRGHHQLQWIEPVVGIFRAVVYLAYADDYRDAFAISHGGN